MSFWSCYNNPNDLGAIEVSPNGGTDWYFLQTYSWNDMTWRLNIHELDEWQGETLMFRWETKSSSNGLFIDDIKVEVWEENDFVDLDIPASSYTFSTHPVGEYWFRAIAMDPDFGPGWPSEPVYALVQGTGIREAGDMSVDPALTELGTIGPNPVTLCAAIPVTISASDAGKTELAIFDLSGRMVTDLSDMLMTPGSRVIHWNCTDRNGNQIPDGVYFCRMHAGNLDTVRRIVVVR